MGQAKSSSSSIIREWKLLNRDLRRLCQEIVGTLLGRDNQDPFITMSGAFLHKATETLSAVNVLYANNLEESAQVLIRVLFELRINFDCFLKLAGDDVSNTCRRVIDAMMLEKVKQARASGFMGFPEKLKQDLDISEKEIEQRYAPDELSRLRRHGFTGVPIEQRASMTGHEAAYSVVYRNFSRNVHSTDYVESYLKLGMHEFEEDPSYYDTRDVIALYTAHFSVGGMAELANHIFSLEFDEELDKLGRRQKMLKSR